jgi:hypothetical protein
MELPQEKDRLASGARPAFSETLLRRTFHARVYDSVQAGMMENGRLAILR